MPPFTHSFIYSFTPCKPNILKNPFIYFLLFALLVTACKTGPSIDKAEDIIAALRKEYAPDKRVAMFDIQAKKGNGGIILNGTTNLTQAKEALIKQLTAAEFSVVDSIRQLPASELGGKNYGVINVSVCNIRSKKGHSQELTTQALLGTPIRVYEKVDSWFRVQTPDGYIAWLDEGGFTWMKEEAYKEWINAPKVLCIQDFGFSYTRPDNTSTRVSDLVGGDILKSIGTEKGYIKVEYPDGRMAYVADKEVINYDTWLASRTPNTDNIVATAKTFLGRPYLWGGTSGKGVDCSGFTKMVFYLNGVQIARDASQQVHAGVEIATDSTLANLKAGDLLFFGRAATSEKKERINHVAIYLGNGQMIHASGDAGVRIESLYRKDANFAEHRLQSFIRAKRMLISLGRNGVDLLRDLPAYNPALL